MLNKILQYKVSYQANTWSSISHELTIEEILRLIKSNKYKSQIDKLRLYIQSGKKDSYDSQKKTLPAVTFCGTFKGKRRKENLQIYNSIIVIDIDKLEQNELAKAIIALNRDPHVFSYWKSPSNKGVKGLVYIKYDFDLNGVDLDIIHKNAFNKLASHFNEHYNIELDKSGSDTSRLCFVSFDNELELKTSLTPFLVIKDDLKVSSKKTEKTNSKIKHTSNKDALYNPKDRNIQRDRKTISSILRFLERRHISISYSYEEWYKVAMSIANTFTYDVGLKYFHRFSSIDANKYIEENCTNFLLSCYETRNGSIKFDYIIYKANEKGYQTKHQKKGFRGGSVKTLVSIILFNGFLTC